MTLFALFIFALSYSFVGLMNAQDRYDRVTRTMVGMSFTRGTLQSADQYKSMAMAAIWPIENFGAAWGVLMGWGAIALLGAAFLPVCMLAFWPMLTRIRGGRTAVLRGAAFQCATIALAWSLLSWLRWSGHFGLNGNWWGAETGWQVPWYMAWWTWSTRLAVLAFLVWTLLFWWSLINLHLRAPRGTLIFLWMVIVAFGGATWILLRSESHVPRMEVGLFLADVFGQPIPSQ